MAPSKVTVLISGGGTNLQAIIDAVASGRMADTQIINVISNRKEAGGLKRAERAGIPTIYHNLLKYKKDHPDLDQQAAREGYDAELAQIILENKPDLIVCAGWMHILAPSFLNPLAAAGIDTINLHPALYGTFDGAGAIQRAYEAFQEGKIEKTGVMIHYVGEWHSP
jgi:phosphoribosylglycinamide formyltransferase